MQKAYSIYETKTHLSQLLKEVRKGIEFTVTDRGRPVARLLPFVQDTFSSIIKSYEESGELRPAAKEKIKLQPGKPNNGVLSRFLAER